MNTMCRQPFLTSPVDSAQATPIQLSLAYVLLPDSVDTIGLYSLPAGYSPPMPIPTCTAKPVASVLAGPERCFLLLDIATTHKEPPRGEDLEHADDGAMVVAARAESGEDDEDDG